METVTGKLKHGMVIDGVPHTEFEMREATVGDLLEAEVDADATKPFNFNAQLMLRQLVRVGDFKGPFTLGMLKRLKPVDFRELRQKQVELDALGEEPASSGADS